MKRILHALSGALIVLTPLACGSLLVYGNGFNTGFRDFMLDSMKESPLAGVAAGLVLVLLGLVYLGTFGRPRSRKRYISFDSENGSVSISINAVRDFVRKIGDEFDAVVGMDPKIRTGKDKLCIDLNVKIQTGCRLPELSEQVQDRVRESIRDGLVIVDIR